MCPIQFACGIARQRSLKYSFVWALTNQTGEPMHVFATKSSLAKTKWMAEMRETIELDEDVPESSPRISISSIAAAGSGGGHSAAEPPATAPRASTTSEASAAAGYAAPPPVAPRPSPAPPPVAARPGATYGGADPDADWDEASWFVGKLDRSALTGLFTNAADGTFLVRESKTR